MIRRGLPLLLALVPLALGACGGDDDDATVDAPDTLPGGVTLPAGVTIPDVTSPDVTIPQDLSDITLPGGVTLPDDITSLSVPELPDMPASGDGSCSVDVTGDITASWTEDQNVSSGLVSAWYTEAERNMLGDDFSMLFNCSGEAGNSLSVYTTSEATAEDVPPGPGTYQLSGGGGAFGVAEGDSWGFLVTFAGSDTNWGVAEPGGTLEVTEFDDDSISFTIDAPLYDSLASMAGTTEQSAHINVSMTYTRG